MCRFTNGPTLNFIVSGFEQETIKKKKHGVIVILEITKACYDFVIDLTCRILSLTKFWFNLISN